MGLVGIELGGQVVIGCFDAGVFLAESLVGVVEVGDSSGKGIVLL